MSDDLIQRLRAHVSPGWGSAGRAMAQATDRIEADEALMRQALDALVWISDCYTGEDDDAGECASCHERSYKPHAPTCKKNNAIAALRARLGKSK